MKMRKRSMMPTEVYSGGAMIDSGARIDRDEGQP
jgi:hypothetical protein